jgi:hypothetical protein
MRPGKRLRPRSQTLAISVVIFVAVVPWLLLPAAIVGHGVHKRVFHECLDVRRPDQANYGVEMEYDWTELAFRCEFGDGTTERVGIRIAWSSD